MAHFDELLIHCDVLENPELTLSQFEQGLRLKIRCKMMLHSIDTMEVAFQRACEIEHYQKVESRRSLPLVQIK